MRATELLVLQLTYIVRVLYACDRSGRDDPFKVRREAKSGKMLSS
jgi:hypothetical protein